EKTTEDSEIKPLVNAPINERYLYDSPLLRQMLGITVFDEDPEAEGEDTGTLLDPIAEEAKKAYIQGAFGEQSGFRGQAYRALLRAAEADPENTWIAIRAGQAALSQNDIANAQRLADRALQIDAKNTNAMDFKP